MSPERWQQVEEIFQTALDLPLTERARFMQQTCAGDIELRDAVEALLTQYEEASDFLNEPLLAQSGLTDMAALLAEETDALVGERLGAYRILRQIGRGGMGAVYLAERADNTFYRQVAIKVIKRGMDTDFILRRFRHERQILAALDHPHITRLLDGGATPGGLPYFVMEHVEGEPLYAYCDARRLPVSERLRLFCQVCSAVAYAHRQQVIHRDIKPTNILVTASGTAKLFDFGIAKLLNPELAAETMPQTATTMRLMTVEYASPEQVQGLPVTFRSDVYSLGVLLYELLTGQRPYRFRSRLLHEMARVIAEEEPLAPSAAVERRGDSSLVVAPADSQAQTIEHLCELRGETAEGLRQILAGSLDSIVLRALRKEPAERYQSAQELQADIERYLVGEEVSAPLYYPSAARPLYPGATGLAASSGSASGNALKSIAVLPLKILNLSASADTGDKYLGLGLADAMITKLSGARSIAVRPTSAILRYGDETTDPLQAGRALAVDFVLDGRIKIAGERIRVSLQLLDVQSRTSIWANQFDERSTDALDLEDSLSAKVADALLSHLTEDERQQLQKRGTDNVEAFEAYLRGRFFWNRFTPEALPRAIQYFQQALALDPDYALPHVGVADFYNWASIYGLLPSLESHRQAKAAALRALALDGRLGEAYAALGLITEGFEFDWAEAERLYLRAIELSPSYPLAHEWYASLLVGSGRFAEGLKEMRRAEELDPLSLRAMTLTAWTSYQARQFAESAAKAQQIIDLDKDYAQGYLQLGNVYTQMGRAAEAVAALRQAAQLMPNSALPEYGLCFALVAANRADEARELVSKMKAAAEMDYVMPYFLGMAYAAIDERATALDWFEQAVIERDPWLIWFGTDAKLDPLRQEPRFGELFRRTKNPLAFKSGG